MLEGHDVVVQGWIYQGLAAVPGARPVPRIVSICADPAVIGVPFFVIERGAAEPIDDVHIV